ncbi:hypothetical protein AAC387_Pa03g0820 [Persea americana]
MVFSWAIGDDDSQKVIFPSPFLCFSLISTKCCSVSEVFCAFSSTSDFRFFAETPRIKKEDEQGNMALQLVKDMAISHIVQVALDTAKSCLQNGSGLFLGVQNELEKIKDFLEDIHDFIVIAERSPVKDPKLMKLLEILKDAAFDAEDLMEEHAIEDRRRSVEVQNSRPVRDTITNKVLKVVTSLVTPIINRAELAKKLKELSKRLEAIKAKGDTFQLNERVTNLEIEFKKQRETHSLVNESQVFGREEEKEKIVTLLLSTQLGDEGEHENVSAFVIIGMGGIGKTTLAKLVFNNNSVQNHFKLKMWICVSDNFDIVGLGNEIIQRATGHNPSLSNVEELQCRLRETLSEKRFLLVLDDVWNEEPEKWYRLRDLLMCGGRASRIVITTRSEKVAFIMSKIQPHILKCLSEDDCWSLFSQRAFGNPTEEALHPNLVPIGREIVKKCDGNPLAVTTLGGLLCFERGEHKWEFVKDSEMWNLADENEHQILPALRLSYNHLKPHMKQCFAFCALFPKDYIMEKELLIKLWMANGFIPTKRGMELEDIGNEIFVELVMRSFFQDVNVNVRVQKLTRNGKYWRTSKNMTTFRMHDLMHDLAQSVMKNEYCVVQRDNLVDISQRVRHVSAYGNKPLEILVAFLPKAQMLRTYLMLEDISQCNIKKDAFQFPCDIGLFRCLRALDLIRQKLEVEKQLLTSLGNLQHLRYLNLSFTSIEMLPESLTSLSYLQTLILTRCTELCQLPEKLGKLTNLRCLDIMGCSKLTHMPTNMGQLSSLQELSRFIVGRTNEIACSGIGELQSLNLRGPLQIELLQNITDVTDVPRGNIISKPNLTSLRLKWEYGPSHCEDLGSEEVKEIEVVEKQLLQGLQPHRNLEKKNKDGVVDQQDNAMKKRRDKGGKASCKKNQSSLRISRDLE